MKNELRNAAMEAVNSVIMSRLDGIVTPVTVGKRDLWAFDTGVRDENGKPVYVTLDFTVKNTEDVGDNKAFNFADAQELRKERENTPKKEKKDTSEAEKKKAENAAKRKAKVDSLRDWCLANMTSTEKRTTAEIKDGCAEMTEEIIMNVGKYLKELAEEGTLNRTMENRKIYYTLNV